MLRLLNRSAFDGVTFVNPPVQFDFPYEWWESPDYAKSDLWVEKILPHAIGYCYNGKKAPTHSILCIQKNGLVAFDITRTRLDVLKKHARHEQERIANGVSYRDAWNVDGWLSEKCSKVIELLDRNTRSFPTCMEKLHRKFLEIDGKKMEPCDLPADERDIKWYHEDLKRMSFLFGQYAADEEHCEMKNPYKWNLELRLNPKDKSAFFEGSSEDKEEAERHIKRDHEIAIYRSDCLHKALKLLDVYIEDLWD